MKVSPRVKLFSVEARVANLRHRHHEIKQKIKEELKRPSPCGMALQGLKRRRLQIKDEIARYNGVLRTLRAPTSGNQQAT